MNRTTILADKLFARADLVNKALNKIKGIKASKPIPLLENADRIYVISNWMATCDRCKLNPCGINKWECEFVNWFPIFHRVSFTIRNGIVIKAICRGGKNGEGSTCDPNCKHIDRAKDAFNGEESKGVELAIVYKVDGLLPRCPNCKERWSVSVKDNKFECRNPVCARDEKSWVFMTGTTDRPSSARNEWAIRDRMPGRVMRKHATTKRWGKL